MTLILTAAAPLVLVVLLCGVDYLESARVDGVPVPGQLTYLYDQAVQKSVINRLYLSTEQRSWTYLMCPKHFAVHQIKYGLAHLSKNSTSEYYTKRLTELQLANSGTVANGENFCPTLEHCLLRQACVFRFSNEFCLGDPAEGQRKVIKIDIECLIEEEIVKKRGIFINTSRLSETVFLDYHSTLESGTRDYRHTQIRQRPSQSWEVFDSVCPSARDAVLRGFTGQCRRMGSRHPPSEFWTVMARASRECRRSLLDTACAFLTSPEGRCHPPQSGVTSQAGYSYDTLPMVGTRPDLSRYIQLINSDLKRLIPVRLGFILLIHQHLDAVLQLLDAIYSSHHYYVFHVDSRVGKDFRTELLASLGALSNVRVLSPERSFPASWASFYIARAELECVEELLRMGVWDHAINLSGADLPLRSVEDLAATLAPHRGTSFFSTFPGLKNLVSSKPVNVVCESHVYNLGIRHALDREFVIKGSSQWFILARDLAEQAVNIKTNQPLAERFFRFRNYGIADEFLFSTILFATDFKRTYIRTNLRYINQFQGDNIDGLCRHQDDADFCGRGPGDFEMSDLKAMKWWGVAFNFIARKFPTANTDSPVRSGALQLAKQFTEDVFKFIHKDTIRSIFTRSLEMLDELESQDLLDVDFINVLDFKMIPRLISTRPDCQTLWNTRRIIAEEFLLWMDLSGKAGGKQRQLRVTSAVQPSISCFSRDSGQLAAIKLNWCGRRHGNKTTGRSCHVIPYADEGSTLLTFDLVLDVSEVKSADVQQTQNIHTHHSNSTNHHRHRHRNRGNSLQDTPFQVPSLNTSFRMEYVVQNTEIGIVCAEEVTLEPARVNRNSEYGVSYVYHTLEVRCSSALSAGKYKLLINQYMPNMIHNARQYELQFYVVPTADNYINPQPYKYIRELWPIVEVATLPLEETWYYRDPLSDHEFRPQNRSSFKPRTIVLDSDLAKHDISQASWQHLQANDEQTLVHQSLTRGSVTGSTRVWSLFSVDGTKLAGLKSPQSMLIILLVLFVVVVFVQQCTSSARGLRRRRQMLAYFLVLFLLAIFYAIIFCLFLPDNKSK